MIPSPQRWKDVCRSLGAQPSLVDWYGRLQKLYSEPQRHYHTFHHIADCLTEFDCACHLAAAPCPLELAIWFHDAIYDPRAADNEQRSADLATAFLEQAGDTGKALTQDVATLILATRHDGAPTGVDSGLMIDVDLSILGRAPSTFVQYEAEIRAEYAWVPASIFAAKRAEILERFLMRPRIYSTDLFLQKYEKQARENLQNSVRALRAGS